MLGPHVVTPLTAEPTEDPYGNEERDWGNPDRGDDIPGCSVQPAGADEYVIDREAVVVRYRAFLPGGPPQVPDAANPGTMRAMDSRDRVEWNGAQYVIDGVEPWDFPQLPHTDLLLRRVSG